MKRRLSLFLILFSMLTLGAVAFWTFGPREPVAVGSQFSPASIGADPVHYLAASEADIPNLRPGAEKEIIWAYPQSRAKTPLAIVYIHGFSATKAEIRPVPDAVARQLGANLFYTRLAGHGRNEPAMAEPTVGDWLDDLAEAIAIGRRIGERTIIIATSNGGSLATYAASLPGMMDSVSGMVLISPNYQINDWRSFLLTMPYARTIAPLINGETYGEAVKSKAANEAAETYGWTRGFPTVSLLPMAALTEAAANIDAAKVQMPALFIFSDRDRVVDSRVTDAMAARWAAPHAVLKVEDSTDASQHLIAGDLRSPNTTRQVADAIVQWVSNLP